MYAWQKDTEQDEDRNGEKGRAREAKNSNTHTESKQHCVEETTIVDPELNMFCMQFLFCMLVWYYFLFCFCFHQSIAHSTRFICFENEV